MDPAETFTAILRARATEAPERVVYSFRSGPPDAPRLVHLTHRELLEAASAVARQLDGLAGRPVLLAFPPGLDFIVALFGCMLAGAVAVPIYPPGAPEAVPHALAIAQAAGTDVVLSSPSVAPALAALPGFGPPRFRWITVDHRVRSADVLPADHAARARGPSILQFTSGTTRQPRAVALFDRHLIANSEVIRQRFAHDHASRGVIWLPPYHDMGLIGGILQPLYAGFPVMLMSPLEAIARPERWLAAISEHRATTSGGPDFAYALAARKVSAEQRQRLDLSSWRVAFSGAERVRRPSIDKFAAAFAECGFDRRAFHPCYGLAEATLYATGNQGVVTHPDEPTLVSSGRVAPAHALRIVDPLTGLECADDVVGAIELAGPSVTCEGWLATGDQGRVRDGHLYVVGRDAARIKVRGRLVHAEDIEDAAATVAPDVFRVGRAAAFATELRGDELLVLVQEVRAEVDATTALARINVTLGAHGVSLDALVLVPIGAVPLTSSGKVRREATRDALRDGSLRHLALAGAAVIPPMQAR